VADGASAYPLATRPPKCQHRIYLIRYLDESAENHRPAAMRIEARLQRGCRVISGHADGCDPLMRYPRIPLQPPSIYHKQTQARDLVRLTTRTRRTRP